MKKKSLPLIFFAMLFAFSPSHAQVSGQVEYKSLGLRFTIPATWTGRETEEGLLLGSTAEAGLMVVMPHESPSFEQLKQEADLGFTDDGIQLRRSGEYKQEGARAIGAEFSGNVQGESAKAYVIAVLNPKGGGITVMVVTSPSVYSEQLASRARSLAGSVEFFEPEVSAAVQKWKTLLSDTKLTYLNSSYSQGSGSGGYSTYGGHSAETTLSLCSAGHYKYKGKSSSSIDTGGAFGNSSSKDQDAGTWDVVNNAEGYCVLLLTSHNGSVDRYDLAYRDQDVYLNGTRYYHTGPKNGYTVDCP